MNEKPDLKQLEQKTYNEFLIDGLTELFVGVVLLSTPLMYLNPVFVIYIPFLLFFGPRLFEYIRQYTTYPRIGRVEFKVAGLDEQSSTQKTVIEFLLFCLVILILTCLAMIIFEGKILDPSQWYGWVPFIFGLIMFGPSAFLADKTGRRYYYSFFGFSTLLGFAIALLDFPNKFDAIILYFFSFGLLVLVLGILRFIWFIRNYPVIDLEED